jgi:hypothetical protein
MKKITTAIAIAFISCSALAQTAAPKVTSTPPAPVVPVNIDAVLKFEKLEHDFGNVNEGPQATTEFKFKNISKEPITINNVQASCGCTVPSWTKEPILPGKSGTISAAYNTQGRPGGIHKTLDVQTSKGNKTLTLKGNVNSAPAQQVTDHDHNAPGHVPHDMPPGMNVPPPNMPNPADINMNMPPMPGMPGMPGTPGMAVPVTPPAPKL